MKLVNAKSADCADDRTLNARCIASQLSRFCPITFPSFKIAFCFVDTSPSVLSVSFDSLAPARFAPLGPTFGCSSSKAPAFPVVVNPVLVAFSRNFGPLRPDWSSPHDQPSVSDKNTSNAIRACSLAKSCAELPDGNDPKNSLATASGMALDSGPASRQNFRKRSR
jgi:hypothetical protein